MVTRESEEKSLRALILALNEGLSVYGGLNKNFVPIKVSFSQCTYMTATTAIGELVADQPWGQILGYDGCYDSGTCPHDYPSP